MNTGKETFTYNKDLISLRDCEKDVNLAAHKWDSIFSFLIENTSTVYFNGYRLEYFDSELKSTIDFLADENIYKGRSYSKLIFKVKASSIMLNRGLISKLWERYEYPSLIFLKEELNEYNFSKLCKSKFHEEILSFFEGIYILYRNIEPNVLWIQKSGEMKFPTNT